MQYSSVESTIRIAILPLVTISCDFRFDSLISNNVHCNCKCLSKLLTQYISAFKFKVKSPWLYVIDGYWSTGAPAHVSIIYDKIKRSHSITNVLKREFVGILNVYF